MCQSVSTNYQGISSQSPASRVNPGLLSLSLEKQHIHGQDMGKNGQDKGLRKRLLCV